MRYSIPIDADTDADITINQLNNQIIITSLYLCIFNYSDTL